MYPYHRRRRRQQQQQRSSNTDLHNIFFELEKYILKQIVHVDKEQ